MSQLYKITLLIILIPLGLLTKEYSGPYSTFVHNHAGGILYVIFFIILASLVFPKVRPIKLAIIVFTITCLIEFTQLIQTNFLNRIREYFLVRTLIGSVFNVWDFLWYFVGGVGGWGILEAINRNKQT